MISATHLHAMAVHFPIALLFAAFLFQLISFFYKKEFFSHASLLLLLLGTIGTIVSYLAGDAAGEGIEEGPLASVMEIHEEAAIITLWLSILTSILYFAIYSFKLSKPLVKSSSVIVFVILIASITRTAYYGGQLVYKHGAGVQLSIPTFPATQNSNDSDNDD